MFKTSTLKEFIETIPNAEISEDTLTEAKAGPYEQFENRLLKVIRFANVTCRDHTHTKDDVAGEDFSYLKAWWEVKNQQIPSRSRSIVLEIDEVVCVVQFYVPNEEFLSALNATEFADHLKVLRPTKKPTVRKEGADYSVVYWLRAPANPSQWLALLNLVRSLNSYMVSTGSAWTIEGKKQAKEAAKNPQPKAVSDEDRAMQGRR